MYNTVNMEKTDRYRSFTQIKLPYGVIGLTRLTLTEKIVGSSPARATNIFYKFKLFI